MAKKNTFKGVGYSTPGQTTWGQIIKDATNYITKRKKDGLQTDARTKKATKKAGATK
jgi:hypothetical protein